MTVVKAHNKKRNVGLLYEFLVRLISTSLVEGDHSRSQAALSVFKKHFKPGTELYKEFRLVNSLMKVSVSSPNVAASIISEAKNAARSHNEKQLDREKSFLIRDINHKLDKEGTFWDQPVSEYRMYATIQTLINDWRAGVEAPLDRVAEFEDRLTRWLSEAKNQQEVKEELAGSTGENRLVFKLMMKKLNEKYGCSLTSEQKAMLREYVFTVSTGRDADKLKETFEEIKVKTLGSVDKYLVTEQLNKYMANKVKEAKVAIESEILEEINDATVTRFMLYMKLISELETKE